MRYTVRASSERLERMREYPGASPEEDRASQVSRGQSLRAEGVERVTVVPCMYEHFALLAAWGEPERATIGARTGAVPTADCPRVIEH